MKKSELNQLLREYSRDNLSPTKEEQGFIESIYDSIKVEMGLECIKIGSFPRFTSTRPVHDLDLLWDLGEWDEGLHDPSEALEALQLKIIDEYNNPSAFIISTSKQPHSVTIDFSELDKKIFSVDIVPGYSRGKDDFGKRMFMVPEIVHKSHSNRAVYYENLHKTGAQMGWILSDPLGYIKQSVDINDANPDFRKSVKIIKAWKDNLKRQDEGLKLKSFHLEQVVSKYFEGNPDFEIFDAVFNFFCDIPEIIESPHIPDRADKMRRIDQYLDDFTLEQEKNIRSARDGFLIKLENFGQGATISELLEISFHDRKGEEQFLFDSKIPTLIDHSLLFSIQGRVLPRTGGFRQDILDKLGLIDIDREIEFNIRHDGGTNADLYRWKVKNDDDCNEPRGEITDHHTKRNPEHTKYTGKHYVECYAIKNAVCVAKSRQNVVLRFGQ